MIFRVKSENFNLDFVPPQFRYQMRKYLSENSLIEVEIKPYKEPRTNPQNRFFHLKVAELARELGYDDLEMLKEQLKEKAVSRGYPKTLENGEEVPKHTSDCSVMEMNILIDTVFQEASFCGVILEDNREEYYK